MGAVQHSTLHMGGNRGVMLALAKLRAGIAQDCLISALIFRLLIELH